MFLAVCALTGVPSSLSRAEDDATTMKEKKKKRQSVGIRMGERGCLNCCLCCNMCVSVSGYQRSECERMRE